VLKNLNYDANSDCHKITPHLQIYTDALFVRAPALLNHFPSDFFEAKLNNLEQITFQGLGYTIPLEGFDSNVFRVIGLNKDLLRRFADYFIQKAVGDELKILFDLFEYSNEQIQPMFYQALEKDKLVVDIYLKMLAHAGKQFDF